MLPSERILTKMRLAPTLRLPTSPSSVVRSFATKSLVTSTPFRRTTTWSTETLGGTRTWITASPPLTESGRDDSTLISDCACAVAHRLANANTRNAKREAILIADEIDMMKLLQSYVGENNRRRRSRVGRN